MIMTYTKDEIENIINSWCIENYGQYLYLDKDNPLVQDLKDKFD